MDLNMLPIKTLVKPFKLSKLETKEKEIIIEDKVIEYALKNCNSKIEIRGLRVSEEGFKNTWPNF